MAELSSRLDVRSTDNPSGLTATTELGSLDGLSQICVSLDRLGEQPAVIVDASGEDGGILLCELYALLRERHGLRQAPLLCVVAVGDGGSGDAAMAALRAAHIPCVGMPRATVWSEPALRRAAYYVRAWHVVLYRDRRQQQWCRPPAGWSCAATRAHQAHGD